MADNPQQQRAVALRYDPAKDACFVRLPHDAAARQDLIVVLYYGNDQPLAMAAPKVNDLPGEYTSFLGAEESHDPAAATKR